MFPSPEYFIFHLFFSGFGSLVWTAVLKNHHLFPCGCSSGGQLAGGVLLDMWKIRLTGTIDRFGVRVNPKVEPSLRFNIEVCQEGYRHLGPLLGG
ncbi:hypothetical protein AAFF_G00047400 [Aldrovandia affinis]|uniref:Uncharacterized protein n=1 Tax=Aldrovandia affinis TaxID=143900 RepID=A0AAD7WEZ0_9TELE|nr:hypothetical protein AAFF_G00047400 [Aldrovandia affinis]